MSDRKMMFSFSRLLEMLHMDLMGPMQGKKYCDMLAIYRQCIMYRRVSIRYFMEKYRSDEISREIQKISDNPSF